MNLYRWIHPLAAVVMLSLSACNAAPPDVNSSARSSVAAANKSVGVVETADGRYAFTATSCAIHFEDDEWDIEIAGPGIAPDGEMVFVQFSSTGDVLTIELGVDTASASSDRILTAGEFNTNGMQVEVSGRNVRVADLELVDEHGKRRSGSFQAEC